MGQRMERVDVREQPERRLRTARRQQLTDTKSAERILALRVANGLRRLRVNVVRVRISRMHERGVAGGVPGLQTGEGRVDADSLRADADPGITLANELLLH